jgi:hypothetical protein
MQDGIKRAWTQTVTVHTQLTDHIKTENGRDGRVMQDMQSDEA